MSANSDAQIVSQRISELRARYANRERETLKRRELTLLQHAFALMVLRRIGVDERTLESYRRKLRKLDRRYTYHYSLLLLKRYGDRILVTCAAMINAVNAPMRTLNDMLWYPFVAHRNALRLVPPYWRHKLMAHAQLKRMPRSKRVFGNPLAIAIAPHLGRRFFVDLLRILDELKENKTTTRYVYSAMRERATKHKTPAAHNAVVHDAIRRARSLGLVQQYGRGCRSCVATLAINREALNRYMPVVTGMRDCAEVAKELIDEARGIAETLL